MAIWRGTGGPGDATTDAASEASAAANSATSAAASASAAASSAASAASDATSASTSATNATTAKNDAVTARDAAQAAQTAAETAKTDAQTAQTASENAQSYAEEWATQTEDTLISTPAGGNGVDDYSSMHHAIKAAASASSASSSASSASSSASTATTKASEASTSAANAATSESNAATSESNAAASYDAFDDRYLGAKASAPSLDNDGDALLTGALYWDTGLNQLYIWDGSGWNEAAFSVTGSVTSFNTRTGAVTLSSTDVNNALGSDAVLDSDIGTTVQAYSSVLANTTASYTTAEETKLAGIETGATADQTAGEIKTAYESNANTNAFTDAEQTKLTGIETGATADQTAGEIKTAYESNANTNAFTDAEQTKLSGIETGADVTDALNVTAAGALMDSELTSEASVKALDQGVATTDSPSFAGLGVTNTITAATLTLTNDLAVSHGGTGSSTLAANNVLLGNGTSALQTVAPGTSGNILTSDGTTWTSTAPAASGGFDSGTLMLFQQTSAPTGWTKQTTHNDKALRVVSGTAGSGGSVAFSTAMGTPSVDTSAMSAGSHTLTSAQMPSHRHSITAYGYPSSGGPLGPLGGAGSGYTDYTNYTGSSGSHSHSISGSATATINVNYVDIIIASKD